MTTTDSRDWKYWRVIGIDPGPVVGMCMLHAGTVSLLQCDPEMALTVLRHYTGPDDSGLYAPGKVWVVTERFVDGYRSGRVAGRHGSQAAKDLNGALTTLDLGGPDGLKRLVVHRSAAQVKPWATDKRLSAAGIEIANPSTMRHALDAGRHALYAAVVDCGWPDPLTEQGKLSYRKAGR